jgi:hypothetical protein
LYGLTLKMKNCFLKIKLDTMKTFFYLIIALFSFAQSLQHSLHAMSVLEECSAMSCRHTFNYPYVPNTNHLISSTSYGNWDTASIAEAYCFQLGFSTLIDYDYIRFSHYDRTPEGEYYDGAHAHPVRTFTLYDTLSCPQNREFWCSFFSSIVCARSLH